MIEFAIRPYRPEDEEALLAIWNDAVWADPLDSAAWRARYLADPNFRRDTCLVAEAGDRPTGFVLGFLPRQDSLTGSAVDRPCWIVSMGVLPEFRRRGIGSSLFRALELAARADGCSSILVGPYVPSYIAPGVDVAAYPEALAFFDAVGGLEIARPLSMKASLTARRFPHMGHAADPYADEAVVVRAALPQDLLPCLEFVGREFCEWSDDVSRVILALNGAEARYASLQVAMRPDACIGFALSRFERFGPFGVDPGGRGRGTGGRLIEATLVAMRSQGFHTAWFLWTSDRAAQLYQRHGFHEVRRFSLRRKDLGS